MTLKEILNNTAYGYCNTFKRNNKTFYIIKKTETDCHNAFLAQLNLVKGMCSKLLHGTDGRVI